MKQPEQNPVRKESFLSMYLSEKEELLAWIQSQEDFHELLETEASMVRSFYGSSIANPSTDKELEAFREDLDLAKAYILMKEEEMDPVPEYLLRYMRNNIQAPERKSSLVVRLAQAGIQVIDSLSQGLHLRSDLVLSPELRSAALASPITGNDSSFVVFEEATEDGLRIRYQMVRENEEEIYLSLQIESKDSTPNFRQAILRKDGRFILSTRIQPDGIVNFNGLTEGSYTIEFISSEKNKSIDIYVILD